MFVKHYEVPLDVIQLEALERRLPNDSKIKATVHSEWKKCIAGQLGEREVSYQLQFLTNHEFLILHNLRLTENHRTFQMDFVVLHTNFISILEVKNYRGSIYFNKIGQLVHIKEDFTEEVYTNPIYQVDRHKLQLQNWLYENGYGFPPIETFVVIASSTKFLKSEMSTSIQNIVPSANVSSIIMDLLNIYKRPLIPKNQLFILSNQMKASHLPLQRNFYNKFKLQESDLVTGVLCPHCGIVMERKKAKWFCAKCEYFDKNDYIHALNDYYCLINDTITTKKAKEFLRLKEDYMAKYL